MIGIDLPPWAQLALTLLAFLIGAGSVGKWIARLLRDGVVTQQTRALKGAFASADDLNGLRSDLEYRMKESEARSTGAIRAAELANELAEKALQVAESTRQNQIHFQERLVSEVFAPIKEMSEAQREQGETLAAATALLARLTQQVDNMNNR